LSEDSCEDVQHPHEAFSQKKTLVLNEFCHVQRNFCCFIIRSYGVCLWWVTDDSGPHIRTSQDLKCQTIVSCGFFVRSPNRILRVF